MSNPSISVHSRESSLSPGSTRIGMQIESALYDVLHAETALRACVMQLLQYVDHPLAESITTEDDVILDRLTAAMTNIVYRVSSKKCKDSVIIRFYGKGTEVFFSRHMEVAVFRTLSDLKIGPKLLASFGTGRLESFLRGFKSCDREQVRRPEIFEEIMKRLVTFHRVVIPNVECADNLRKKIKNWLAGARLHGQENSKFNLENFEEEVQSILHLTADAKSPLVFLHADLQPGNIMVKSGTVQLIDFEYACFGPRGFDFANFFLEWTYDYNAHDAHRMHTGWMPDESTQTQIFEAYLRETGHPEELESLRRETKPFICYSLLLWSLWGIIQSSISGVDFDYDGYTIDRIHEYTRLKQEYFGAAALPLLQAPVAP